MHKYTLIVVSMTILLYSSACGPTITTVDELMASDDSSPTAQTVSTLMPATPTPNPTEALEQGQRALEEQDYVRAVTLLRNAYDADSTNNDIATLLAEAYAGLGSTLIQQSQGKLASTQEAFDTLTEGLEVAPEGSPVKGQLETDQQAALALLEVVTTLAELTEAQSERHDMTNQRELADEVIRKIEQGAELRTDFFRAANLPATLIEEAAALQEAYAGQFSAEERRHFWETALALRALIETT